MGGRCRRRQDFRLRRQRARGRRAADGQSRCDLGGRRRRRRRARRSSDRQTLAASPRFGVDGPARTIGAMISRRLQTSLAVILAAIWGFVVYFEHSEGRLQFLDRIESATVDIRTLARGRRAPPDLVTIVAIDDNAVKLRGVYPLPRTDLARIIDTIARLEPKVVAVDLLLIAH